MDNHLRCCACCKSCGASLLALAAAPQSAHKLPSCLLAPRSVSVEKCKRELSEEFADCPGRLPKVMFKTLRGTFNSFSASTHLFVTSNKPQKKPLCVGKSNARRFITIKTHIQTLLMLWAKSYRCGIALPASALFLFFSILWCSRVSQTHIHGILCWFPQSTPCLFPPLSLSTLILHRLLTYSSPVFLPLALLLPPLLLP